MIEIKIETDTITAALQAIQSRLIDMTPLMRQISGIMLDAVEANFAAEGRPKWRPSRRATGQGGKTLQDTGQLAASIVSKYTQNQAMVGTNVIYAAIHQFGGKTAPHVIKPKNKKALFWPGAKHPVKSVKHPGSDIPARPFLSLTDSDYDTIKEKISEYLTR
jgi:phage virion morphogenesis protein